MKKLIFVLSLLFAFTINANAQDKSQTAVDNATKEAAMLQEATGISNTQTTDLQRLFEMKYQTLEDKNLSAERKQEFLKIVMLKIEASLTPEQMQKLNANPVLLDRIKTGVKSK